MEARPMTHPSADTLQAFSLGKLTDAAASDSVLLHIETCADCRDQVVALSGDSFLERLREARWRTNLPDVNAESSDKRASAKATAGISTTPPVIKNLPIELRDHPQYEVQRELGRGGMGVVYLARNKLMDRLEVLKVLNKKMLDRSGAGERFLREIRSAAKLSHPNVVVAHNAMQLGELLVFAMEYVPGEDLAQVVKTSGGPLPVLRACYYVQQTALGLQHAFEKGMVHRDIKPHNLILLKQDKKHVVKILDFGLAKARIEGETQHDLTGAGQMLGTPDYMAPEQWVDAATADIRADIYSLGCTLYFLLSSHAPFKGGSLPEIWEAHETKTAQPLNEVRSDVPPELAAVAAKMMAKKAAERYQQPIEVAQTLLPFIKAAVKGASSVSISRPSSVTEVVTKEPAKPGVKSHESAQEVRRETLAEGPSTMGEGRKNPATPSSQPAGAKSAANRRSLYVAGGVTVLLMFVVLGLLASGLFKVKTKDGIIVLENLPTDADVLVDGEKVTVAWGPDRKEAQISVKPGTHKIVATSRGVKVIGEEVEIVDGGSKVITARLEPMSKVAQPASQQMEFHKTEDKGTQHANVGDSKQSAIRVLEGHEGPVRHLLFTPDGLRLVSASNTYHEWRTGDRLGHDPGKDTGLKVWSVESGRVIRKLLINDNFGFGLQGIGLSGDGRFVAACTGWDWNSVTTYPRVHVWDIASGTRIHYFVPPGNATMRAVGFSADGKTLYAARSFFGLHSWSLSEGPESGSLDIEDGTQGPGRPLCSIFTQGCRYNVGGAWNNAVKVWNRETRSGKTLSGHKKVPTGVAMSPDETRVVSCADDFSVRMWELESGRQIYSLDNLDSNVVSVVFSNDGKRFLTGGEDGIVRLRDVATGKEVAQFTGHNAKVGCVAYSPDGRFAASGSEDKSIRLWQLP